VKRYGNYPTFTLIDTYQPSLVFLQVCRNEIYMLRFLYVQTI
jgi:hypothetical protein